jgi:type VI secretion system protein ImpE
MKPDSLDQVIAEFNAGNLDAAVVACEAALRASIQNQPGRILLTQLLCCQENWARAEKIADQVMRMANKDQGQICFAMVTKQLIAAEKRRAGVWTEGHAPELLGEKDDHLAMALRLLALERSGRPQEARDVFQSYLPQHPISGTCNGQAFRDFHDVEARTARIFELLLPTGGYFWVSQRSVQQMIFSQVTRPLDQCWRQVQVELLGGASLHAYMPVRYFGSQDDSDPNYRAGRASRWDEYEGQLDVGVGRRVFTWVPQATDGAVDVCALGIQQVRFAAPVG